jgi:hypothetical protein
MIISYIWSVNLGKKNFLRVQVFLADIISAEKDIKSRRFPEGEKENDFYSL